MERIWGNTKLRPRVGAKVLRAASVAIAASVVAACSVLSSLDAVQCTTDAECSGKGASETRCIANVCSAAIASTTPGGDAGGAADAGDGGGGGPWGCVGQPTPPSNLTIPEKVTIYSFDGVSTLEPETESWIPRLGVKVRLCAKRDPACATPLTPTVEVDAKGLVEFPMPPITDFFVEGTAGPDIVPMLVVPAFTGDGKRRLGRPIYVGTLSKDEIATLGTLVGTAPDPALGIILTRQWDCLDARTQVAGISFQPEQAAPSIVPFYMRDGFPSGTATETDKNGLGGFANVPVGQITFYSFFASSKQRIGRAAALTRAGWMTTLEIQTAL